MTQIGDGISRQVLAIFFLGVFGYALRVHERWWPYFLAFDRNRKSLDDAIEAALGRRLQEDHINLYKYFLETKGTLIKGRVHYFSSFYYMLIELSLFSFLASLGLVCWHLTDGHLFSFASLHLAPRGTGTASALLAIAIVVQMFVLLGISGLRRTPTTARQKLATLTSYAPPFLAAASITMLIIARLFLERGDLLLVSVTDGRLWALALFGTVLASLGVKQWQAVVGEQVVFVNEMRQSLREVARLDA